MSKDRFQIGDYYLVQHPNSPVFKAGWYDAERGQTRRVSLGTKDFYEAKVMLAEFAMKQLQPKEVKSEDMPLALVLYRYWEGHAKNIASAEAARAALSLWTQYWETKTVADLTNIAQKDFMGFLKACFSKLKLRRSQQNRNATGADDSPHSERLVRVASEEWGRVNTRLFGFSFLSSNCSVIS